MLSIRVAQWGVILLGLVIFGYRLILYIVLISYFVLVWIQQINIKIATDENNFLISF